MKILLYCKNSEENEKAVQIALEQAKAFDASVLLVSCIQGKQGVPTEITEKTAAKIEAKMQDYIDNTFAPAGISCSSEVIVTSGPLGEKIVSLAKDNKVDTIVMSIQKRSKIGKMVFGSNSQFVILEAPCKVITIN